MGGRVRIRDVRDMQAGICAYDCRRIETRFTQRGLLVPFLKQYPDFQNLADPDMLHNARKQVSTVIDHIHAFYSTPAAG